MMTFDFPTIEELEGDLDGDSCCEDRSCPTETL